jgi:hypothetical protein
MVFSLSERLLILEIKKDCQGKIDSGCGLEGPRISPRSQMKELGINAVGEASRLMLTGAIIVGAVLFQMARKQ